MEINAFDTVKVDAASHEYLSLRASALEKMYDAFEKFVDAGVSKDEFIATAEPFFRCVGESVKKRKKRVQLLDLLYTHYDVDLSNHVHAEELLVGFTIMTNGLDDNSATCDFIYDHYAHDDEYLRHDELEEWVRCTTTFKNSLRSDACREKPVELDARLESETVKMMNSLDTDGDQRISQGEFQVWFAAIKAAAEAEYAKDAADAESPALATGTSGTPPAVQSPLPAEPPPAVPAEPTPPAVPPGTPLNLPGTPPHTPGTPLQGGRKLDLAAARALLGVTDAGYDHLHDALMGAADPETEGLTRSVFLATASELTVGADAAVEVRTRALALLGTVYDHFKAFDEFDDHGAGSHEFVEAERLALGFQAVVQHGTTVDETAEMLFKALDYDNRGIIEEFELDAFTKSSELFRNALRVGADQLPFKKVIDASHMLLEEMLDARRVYSLDDRKVTKAELRAYLQAAEKNATVPPGTPPNLPEPVAAAETPLPLYLDDG